MNNKFINNNGANLLHTKNKKTKVESQIEMLKQQEQEISKQLEAYQVKQKKSRKFNPDLFPNLILLFLLLIMFLWW